ncbi:type IV pilin protein [Thiolapillus sp.]
MKKTPGFTLVELMIVVAVVGVLAAIAYPGYIDHVRKARRADAKAALTEVAQKLEALYARNASYSADLTDIGYPAANWNNVPINVPASNRWYQVRVLAPNANCAITNCYRLRARRRPGTDQVNDDIEFYDLWSNGRKRYRKGGSWTNSWAE